MKIYHPLLRLKKSEFWQNKIECHEGDARSWRRVFDSLLGRVAQNPPSSITAEDFAGFFTEKISSIRNSTDNASFSHHEQVQCKASLSCFNEVSPAEISKMIKVLPNKHSMNDPLPTRLLKESNVHGFSYLS